MKDLMSYLEQHDAASPAVSDWSVGQHLQHCALVVIGVHDALQSSTPFEKTPGKSLRRILVFASGRIPRGRGKARAQQIPTEACVVADTEALLMTAAKSLEQFDRLPKGAWFRHGAFGVLNVELATRFIEIHNAHHGAIIADILAS